MASTITYVFRIDGGAAVRFDVDPERQADQGPWRADEPAWTALTMRQCSNCPLDPGERVRCPAAADLLEIIAVFGSVDSTSKADVRVITDERTYHGECDVQTGLGSLLGLVMATSGCPILNRMRPMARTHLPFATVEETVFRTASAFLLEQHFVGVHGGEPDYALRGLRQLYADLQTVNACFADRLRAAATQDASLNAVARLFSLSALVSFSLDDELMLVERMYFGRG